MTKDKSRIQSCVDHINTAVDVDPWAKELVAEMGKEVLKAQLSCEGTTSDCISRQAVRFIETNSDSYPEEWNDDYEKGFTDALNKVIALPSAQPERKTGKWIPQDHNKRAGNISTCVYCYPICSKCGKVGIGTYKYCPMCGAKMEGADDE